LARALAEEPRLAEEQVAEGEALRLPRREYDIDSDVDDDDEAIVTKLEPHEEMASQAEDISARGQSRSLFSLHGGGDQLPETPESRRDRLGGGGQ
jgi:hypothetical protein